MFNFVRANTMA